MQRLEDLRAPWQAETEATINSCVANLAAKLSAVLASSPAGGTPVLRSELGVVSDPAVHQFAEGQLLPRCLDWLHRENHWPEPVESGSFIRSELGAALQHLPPFRPYLPEPTLVVPIWSWVIAAGVGALVGMLPFALLGWVLTGQREAGLVVGGIAGSTGLVLLVGLLSQAPFVRSALSSALAIAGTGSLLGGLWAYWRGQGNSGWLRGGLGLLATWLVVVLTQPRLSRPDPNSTLAQIQDGLRAHLRHVADLILGWCWAHPQRRPEKPRGKVEGGSEPLPGSVCRSLGDLHAHVTEANGTGLRDTVEILLQRLDDAGYEWKHLPAGTSYDESMKKDFETFSRIEPGQPIRTRRPALHVNGKFVQKGELQRQ